MRVGSCSLFVLCVSLSIGVPALTSAARMDGPSLTVTVLDAFTLLPVPGASVEIGGRPAAAVAPDGRVRLEALNAGRQSLRVVADGFHPFETAVDVAARPLAFDVLLVRRGITVDESVIVAATRAETRARIVPRSTSVIDRAALDERSARTAPEALQDQPGGWVQKTNHGGGSPFLRGFVGNQVLVLVDGIRLNNATFRLGPNQYTNTVDAYSLARIEVVRGSGSVQYGSDAIGGVVNLVTTPARLSTTGFEAGGAAAIRLASGGMEQSGRVDGQVSGRHVGARAGVTWRSFGDLVAGGSLGTETPSAYDELDVDAAALWVPAARTKVSAVFQSVHQSDVPRYDQVAQRGYAVYAFDPQARRLGYVQLEHAMPWSWLGTTRLTASWHRSEEGRVRRKEGSPLETREHDTVSTAGVSVDLAGRLSRAVTWQGGVDVYHDVVRSRRRDTNLASGAAADLRGLYPDGATRLSLSAYTRVDVSVARWHLEAGSRFTRDDVRADDPVFGDTHITPDAVVNSLAARVDVSSAVHLFGSVSQAFRAPNIDDLSTLGAFDYGIEVPPGSLAPERSLAIEGGAKLHTGRIAATVAAYRMGLRDLIDRERATFNGAPLLDGQDVYHRANVGRAVVHGSEADVEWRATETFTVFGFLAAAHGQQTSAGVPMRRIPPLNGLAGVRYRRPRGAWVETTTRVAAAQHRLHPGDASDHRISPGGTAGWTVVNLAAGWPLTRGVWVTGGVANLFDRAYRIHGSGVDGPGRHLWIALRAGVR